MIFGMLNTEKILHENLTHLSTSPIRCSYFTLGNPKNVIFNSNIHKYRKKVPDFRMALCNTVGEMNQQKSMYVMSKYRRICLWICLCHLKHFHISRDTSEIVLHVIKQRMQAFRHLCCWLYAGYTRTSQQFVSVNWSAENVLNRSSILLCHNC